MYMVHSVLVVKALYDAYDTLDTCIQYTLYNFRQTLPVNAGGGLQERRLANQQSTPQSQPSSLEPFHGPPMCCRRRHAGQPHIFGEHPPEPDSAGYNMDRSWF